MSKRRELWISIALAAVTLAVYSRVYRHEFIEYDDRRYILDNRHVTAGLTREGVAWAFTSAYASNWHPLTWLSHMVDCQLFGLNAGPQHLVSLGLHVANAVLLFLLFARLTGALWKSAFVAAMFALHPLHVQSVAWIAERKDVLSTLFLILTLWAYARYVYKPGRQRYAAALGLFALGLMAKPMLVTLPFVLLLLDYWPLDRISGNVKAPRPGVPRPERPAGGTPFRAAIPLVREKIPFFILSAAASIVTYAVQKAGGAVKTEEVFPLAGRVANAIHSYAAYLGKAFWPAGLSIFYRYPAGGPAHWKVAGAALLLLCLTFLSLRLGRRLPYLATGWFWYAGTLVPVIGVVQVGMQAMADRYTYVPLIGVFVVVAWGLPDLAAGRPGAKRLLATGGALLVLACSAATWLQLRWWQDAITLFSHALELDEENDLAHAMLGSTLAMKGRYEEGIYHLREDLRLKPDAVDAMTNLGNALFEQGKKAEALEQYSRALSIDPDYPYALRRMGILLLDQGRFAEAERFLRRARLRSPDDPDVGCALGNVLAVTGRRQEAIDAFHVVLRVRPDHAGALAGIGIALAAQGKASEAAGYLEKAVLADPANAETQNNLGNVLLALGQAGQACVHYDAALSLRPDFAEAHYNLGVALQGMNRTGEAAGHYREALRLRPDYAEASYNLAGALDAQGDVPGAIANYAEAIRRKPDFSAAYHNLGSLLLSQGQVQGALEVFNKALSVNPEDAEARRSRDQILDAVRRSKRNPFGTQPGRRAPGSTSGGAGRLEPADLRRAGAASGAGIQMGVILAAQPGGAELRQKPIVRPCPSDTRPAPARASSKAVSAYMPQSHGSSSTIWETLQSSSSIPDSAKPADPTISLAS